MTSLMKIGGVTLGVFLGVSCYAAPEKVQGYPKQVEAGWLDGLNDKKTPVASEVESAIKLFQQTAALVERDGGVVSDKTLKKFKGLKKRWKSGNISPDELKSFYLEVRWLRRDVLFSNPKLNFDQILINRNPPTMYAHNGDQYLGRHSRSGPGLTLLNNWKVNPTISEPLKGKLPKGATRNPDLSFDGKRVLFGFSNHEIAGEPVKDGRGNWAKTTGPSAPKGEMERRYYIYEAALDGSWVRQVTGTKDDPFQTQDGRMSALVEDNDPCYLPDGDILFVSTRSQTFGRCHGTRYNPSWVLYRSTPDGKNITQLSFGNENECEPSVLNDGRIVFTRWEYTNRHEMLFHMLWVTRPDGTGIGHFYGNDTLHPMMVVEATALPGSHKVVATAQGHHQYNTGTSIVIDTTKGENGEEPVTHITPEVPYAESEGWPNRHYSHPYPISEELFLMSRAAHMLPHQNTRVPAAGRAIYLVDSLGGREFIYEDPNVASVSPIPVQPRKAPPALPSMVREGEEKGTLFLQNVYLTRNDPEGKIKQGDIKALRINALGVQPRAEKSGVNPFVGVDIPKRVLGTVPVNPDGSAFFNVPANTPIQIQSLDEYGRAILTEKTFSYLMPGETRSCVGCHEPVGMSPDASAMSKSMRNGPVELIPQAGPQYEGGMSFFKTVQPVLDRYCIGCHGLDKTEGGIDMSMAFFKVPDNFEGMDWVDEKLHIPPQGDPWFGNKRINQFKGGLQWYPRSYIEFAKRGDFSLGLKRRMSTKEGNISHAYEPYYARGCSISDMIIANHGNVNMDADSKMRLMQWMDLNGQYTGDNFPGARIEGRWYHTGALGNLREEIRKQLGDDWAGQSNEVLVNRVFPQESRILMAPLAISAGGWGQVALWDSKDDAGFKQMEILVNKCIVSPENENDMGWNPTLEKGAGEPWVMKDQELYRNWLDK